MKQVSSIIPLHFVRSTDALSLTPKAASTRLCTIFSLLFLLLSVSAYSEENTPHGERLLLTAKKTHTLPKLKKFSKLSFDAKIIPISGAGRFRFLVNYTNKGHTPRSRPPSSVNFEALSSSCSNPLELSVGKVDKNHNYSYQTFFESFSPFSTISLEFEYVEKRDGLHHYLMRVNGVEKSVAVKQRLYYASFGVVGADMEITNLLIEKRGKK